MTMWFYGCKINSANFVGAAFKIKIKCTQKTFISPIDIRQMITLKCKAMLLLLLGNLFILWFWKKIWCTIFAYALKNERNKIYDNDVPSISSLINFKHAFLKHIIQNWLMMNFFHMLEGVVWKDLEENIKYCG